MSIADELERLQTLRERGAISAQEYERVKAR
ncbi:MAG: SHOCT domain-containing protein, partial [Steroidobacteraceae bacterium]